MTAQMLHNISPERPLVINSYNEAVEVLRIMLTDAGLFRDSDQVQEIPQTTTRRGAQKILKDKGYLVGSEKAFIDFVRDYRTKDGKELTRIKRGREYWYNVAELSAIPSRV